jgi:hypothetical protein
VRDEPMEEKEIKLDEWGDISEPEPELESKSKGK